MYFGLLKSRLKPNICGCSKTCHEGMADSQYCVIPDPVLYLYGILHAKRNFFLLILVHRQLLIVNQIPVSMVLNLS